MAVRPVTSLQRANNVGSCGRSIALSAATNALPVGECGDTLRGFPEASFMRVALIVAALLLPACLETRRDDDRESPGTADAGEESDAGEEGTPDAGEGEIDGGNDPKPDAGSSPDAGAPSLDCEQPSFTLVKTLEAFTHTTDVEPVDLDDDGDLDLAISSWGNVLGSMGRLTIYRNDGRFAFTSWRSIEGQNVWDAASGDFDEDGNADIAIILKHQNSSVRLLPGRGDGSFRSEVILNLGYTPGNVGAGDYNADGHLDLLTTRAAEGDSGELEVGLGHGDLTFERRSLGTLSPDMYRVKAARLDGDAFFDFAVSGDGGIGLFFGSGQAPISKVIPGLQYGIDVGDFNDDGVADIATAGNASGDVAVVLRSSTGAMQNPLYTAVSDSVTELVAADLDGDGDSDLVVSDEKSDRVFVLIGRGNGRFDVTRTIAVAGQPGALSLADLDGDGVLDLTASLWGGAGAAVLRGTCQ